MGKSTYGLPAGGGTQWLEKQAGEITLPMNDAAPRRIFVGIFVFCLLVGALGIGVTRDFGSLGIVELAKSGTSSQAPRSTTNDLAASAENQLSAVDNEIASSKATLRQAATDTEEANKT
jgi:hypothetical protein